jgi:hypothetical protein
MDAGSASHGRLAEEPAVEFGQANIFRPYRDIRFSNDKTPGKTHNLAEPAQRGCPVVGELLRYQRPRKPLLSEHGR